MKRSSRYLRTAVTLVAVAGALANCTDSTPPNLSGTYFGPATALADGSGRAYVTLDQSGVPTDIGVALTEATLNGLPAATQEYVFVLPSEASATAFKHATINWQPQGHPPPMIYTVPHFDVHFYTITNAERVAIVLGDSLLAAKMNRQPAAQFIPTGYIVGMASVGMGLHWRDPSAPELNGAPFTKTFIYGSYDGNMIFAEPMMTKAYLETKPAPLPTPVKLPTQYSVHGYQATSYTVGYDASAKEYRIALSGLVLR